MPGLRSYGDPCGIARALDIAGERWSLLIVRELIYGPKRFSDLRTNLGASPNVLTQRLGELEESGVVQKRTSGGAQYELTQWGRELQPVLLALAKWGRGTPHVPTGTMTADALMIAVEAAFPAGMASAGEATIRLTLGADCFEIKFSGAAPAVVRTNYNKPDAVIETDIETFRSLVFNGRPLEDAPVVIEGRKALALRFLRNLKLRARIA